MAPYGNESIDVISSLSVLIALTVEAMLNNKFPFGTLIIPLTSDSIVEIGISFCLPSITIGKYKTERPGVSSGAT